MKIYNTDERWARRILVDSDNRWPQMNLNMRNGKRITMDSDMFVHLVIFGMTSTGEVIATTAAKTCHHPNYITKGIRTKITVIDKDFSKNRGVFHGRYTDFMAMCHYTIRRINNNKWEEVYKHTPKEEYDFLDVEWDFIEAVPDEILLQNELNSYANCESSLLTVVVCEQDVKQNVSIALGLPKIYFDNSIPVWLYTRTENTLRTFFEYSRYDNIMPWGMLNSYPTQEFWEEIAAKHLNLFFNKLYTDDNLENSYDKYKIERSWEQLPLEIRSSNIVNAAAIPVFVGSMKNWSYETYDFTLSDDEINIFAHLEHIRWSVGVLLRGYRPTDNKIDDNHYSGDGKYRDISFTLKKQFYNSYICKYENIKDKMVGKINREIIKYYKQIIYQQLK